MAAINYYYTCYINIKLKQEEPLYGSMIFSPSNAAPLCLAQKYRLVI